MAVAVDLPVWDLEPRDVEAEEMGTDIGRHDAEVLRHHFGGAGCLDDHAQARIARGEVRRAIAGDSSSWSMNRGSRPPVSAAAQSGQV